MSTPPPFLAFLTDEESRKATQALVTEKGWPDFSVQDGTIEVAINYLKDSPTPKFLLVEIPASDQAPELLDTLADVCAPGVKVIVTSKVNEYSFFAWLMEIGIHQYLLQPFTSAQLAKALEKQSPASAAVAEEKKPGKLVAFMGTRGGVGTTTILANLAYILDKEYKHPVAVLDMDIHFGTVAMAFDIEPTRGITPIFENPDRIDSLFLDRVTANFSSGLSLISAEEPLKNVITPTAEAAATLQRITTEKYPYVLVDLPRALTPLTRHFLEHADQVVLVTELTLLSLRDLLRMTDYLKEMKKAPLVIANREGLASKHEITKKDFEKHYGTAIPVHIPCMMEAFSTAASGEILIETTKNSAGLAALHQLAGMLLGEDAKKQVPEKDKKRLGWRVKGKATTEKE